MAKRYRIYSVPISKRHVVLRLERAIRIIERQREALKKIVNEGDFTAPEGMTRIACEALDMEV